MTEYFAIYRTHSEARGFGVAGLAVKPTYGLRCEFELPPFPSEDLWTLLYV